MAVEVFKTNVIKARQARMLIEKIEHELKGHTANFDLEDCDHILRVVNPYEPVAVSAVLALMNAYGYHAEVLPDDSPELLLSDQF